MEDHEIEIFVEGTPPKLRYSDEGWTEMKLHDRVRWVCEQHDCDIRFKTDSPFDEITIPSSSSAGTEKKHTNWCTAKKYAKHRVEFKYTVSVKMGNDDPLVDDPIIIVDDEGAT